MKTKTDPVEQPRGRGRPATGQTPKRYFRMDDESWEQLEQAATANEESVSEYIRRVMLRDAGRVIAKQ